MSEDEGPAAWLRATVTADLELARRVKARYVVRPDHPARAGESFWPTPVVRKAWEGYSDPDVRAGLGLVLAHGPQWVIDDAEAKLAILEEHGGRHRCFYAQSDDDDDAWARYDGDCHLVRLLGTGYKHRDGYRPEWAP